MELKKLKTITYFQNLFLPIIEFIQTYIVIKFPTKLNMKVSFNLKESEDIPIKEVKNHKLKGGVDEVCLASSHFYRIAMPIFRVQQCFKLKQVRELMKLKTLKNEINVKKQKQFGFFAKRTFKMMNDGLIYLINIFKKLENANYASYTFDFVPMYCEPGGDKNIKLINPLNNSPYKLKARLNYISRMRCT